MGLAEILYLRFANTMFEPIWNRNYVSSRPDHDGRGLRRRRPRPLLRPRRARCATSSSTTSCRWWPPPRWSRPPAATRRTLKDAHVSRLPRDARRRPGALRARAVRGLPGRSTACAADSTTETYAALRLEIDNWRWSGVPFFIRTGKHLPVTQTELRLVFQQPAAARLRRPRVATPGARPARHQARPDDRHPDARRGPARRRAASPSRSTSTWSSPRRAARARRRTRCCCTPR